MNPKPIKPSFQTAAQRCEGYSFDYAREAREFYAAYPERRDRLMFVDLYGGVIVHPDKKLQAEQQTLLTTKPYMINLMVHSQGIGSSLTVNYQLWSYIILNTKSDRAALPRLLGAFATRDMESVNIIDHEIGHQICRGGYAVGNYSECVADVYAAIRHMQRFGAESPYIRNMVDTRAVELFFRGDSGIHFTSQVLKDLFSEVDAGRDFSGMSIKETAEAARVFVEKCSRPTEMIADTATDFQMLKGGLKEMAQGNFMSLRALAKAVLAPDAKPMTREWGAVAIRALLDGRVMCENVRIQPVGQEWIKLRLALEALSPPAANTNRKSPKP